MLWPLQTVWIQMRRRVTRRLIRIQTVWHTDTIFKKNKTKMMIFENFEESKILVDDKFSGLLVLE